MPEATVYHKSFILIALIINVSLSLPSALCASPTNPTSIDSLSAVIRKYLERSMPDMAIPLLMKSLEMLPTGSDEADYATIELCEAYRQKQEYHKGIGLISDLLKNADKLSDRNRVYAYNRMAALYNESGDPSESYTDSVFKYSLLCIVLAEKTGDLAGLAAAQNELSYQYNRKKEFGKALDLARQAISNYLQAGKPFYAMNALINQSNIYLRKKDFDSALYSLSKATLIAPPEKNRNLYLRIYYQYAVIYSETGDLRKALDYLKLAYKLQQEFFKDRINQQILEQSARFDLFVKEQKIREAQEKNDYNQRQIILLIMVSVALLVALVLIIFYFRLSRKGIIRKKLINAALETETNERRRIARDLHDGLGPLLSAVNHYFQAFLDAKPDKREFIQERLQKVISEAIDEVSRISHNISPHVLEKHGLSTAINNLMAPLAANGKYEISAITNLEGRPDPKSELTVYRCITELLNNTIRHAEATQITLDLSQSGNQLLLTYTDNGKGIDFSRQQTTGMGLHNLKNRVESSGGTISILSSPGSGIFVTINIPSQYGKNPDRSRR